MSADVVKFHFRLVLLGSHGTGKTSILNKFLFKKFETKYKPTVEDLFSKDFDLGSIEIKVDFLDTSGSMQFPAMRRLSITTGNAFLIVYSVDDQNSYEVLKMCIAEIQEIRPDDFQEIPIVFAGNKCDIPRERRQVTKEVVSNYVHYELPRLRAKVIECSCRDGINIDNLFRAYLSLARVSLSANVAAPNVKKSSRSSCQTPAELANNQQTNRIEESTGSRFQLTSGADGNDIAEQQNKNNNNDRRTSSLKDALGVRKSCDGSILSPRKSAFSQFISPFGGGGSLKQQSRLSTATTNSKAPTATNTACSSPGASFSPKTCISDLYTTTMTTVNLETAIQSKLNVSREAPKPRSRSLIWRPARKSQRAAVEAPDCKVS